MKVREKTKRVVKLCRSGTGEGGARVARQGNSEHNEKDTPKRFIAPYQQGMTKIKSWGLLNNGLLAAKVANTE